MPSLYDITVPPFIRGLTNMAAYLEKGRAHVEAAGESEDVLTTAKLYEDMGDLIKQVQRATDAAKFVAVRVGGVTNVSFLDEEVTMADAQARIAKTIDFLKSAPRAGFDDKESAEVIVKTPTRELTFTGETYVLGFAIPNFYFHVTTAYALLRMKGVPVGKLDFLGGA